MDELKVIWKRNTLWQNITWVGTVLLFCAIMPYHLVKEYFFPGDE